MLRAGPFSDERVVRLINRRFVPLYFDIAPGGAAADANARAFVLKVKPELGGQAVATPPVLLITPNGELLSEIDNYASEADMLAGLRDVLAKAPEWNLPSAGEKTLAGAGSEIERANLRFDLGDDDGARKILEDESSAEAAVLLAHVCRLAKDWKALEQALSRVEAARARGSGAEFDDDVRVERAWLHHHERDFAAAAKEVAKIARKSDRYSESRYLTGLAQWHQGKKDDALATWNSAIDHCSQDPWVYRADWAYTQGKDANSGRTSFSTGGKRTSPLGRIGYMGRRNPDLDLP